MTPSFLIPGFYRRAASTLAAGASVLALALGVSAAAAPTACACSCSVVGDPAAALAQYDGVFVGTPTNVRTVDGNVEYDFTVREVYAGDLAGNTVVTAPANTDPTLPSCGVSFEIGKEVTVVGTINLVDNFEIPGREYSISDCGALSIQAGLENQTLPELAREVFGAPEGPLRPVMGTGSLGSLDTAMMQYHITLGRLIETQGNISGSSDLFG